MGGKQNCKDKLNVKLIFYVIFEMRKCEIMSGKGKKSEDELLVGCVCLVTYGGKKFYVAGQNSRPIGNPLQA